MDPINIFNTTIRRKTMNDLPVLKYKCNKDYLKNVS